jgi:hypothetical protein
MPGETLKRLKWMYRLQSQPMNGPLVGAWFDVNWYYVPCRLCDPAFVAGMVAGNYQQPTTIKALGQAFFSTDTQGVSALVIKAYDLIVNRFFRTPEIDGVWTTTTALAPAQVADLTAEMLGVKRVDKADVLVPLRGTSPNQTVSMQDLKEGGIALRQAVARDNMDSSYTGYLETFGVSRDDGEGFLAEPEHLGGFRKFVAPSKAVDPLTGATVQSYFLDGEYEMTQRKYFREHGILLGLMTFRPKMFLAGKLGQIDDYMSGYWSRAGNVEPLMGDVYQSVDADKWACTENLEMDLRAPLFRGEQLVGEGVNDVDATHVSWVSYKNPTSLADARSLAGVAFADTGKLGAAFQMDATLRMEIVTPLAKPALY